MGENSNGYGYWWISTLLIALGVLSAILSAMFALMTALRPSTPAGVTLAATPLALAALALIASGGVMRWSMCCGDDCCDWDDENAINVRGPGQK